NAPSVIATAAFALGELKSDSAVQPLSRLLGHEDPNIRKQVATAYAKMGEMGLAVLQEAFEGAWQQKENNAVHLRLTVMTVYLEMVEFHPDLMGDVLPLVVRALDDENWLVKAQAAQVVGRTAQMLSLKESLAPEDPL
ncbi:MAG: HEAT repeat domain-containing protein, partial [Vampirovibrio sp.]|nr:HEAT repeat domain-containing protein [Vampirovibrio sp.]